MVITITGCEVVGASIETLAERTVNGFDQQVDVLGRAGAAVSDNGEPADEDIARPGVVQRLADAGEVFDLRLACVRAIVRVIHASASSKLVKR